MSVNIGAVDGAGRRRTPRYEIVLKVTWQSARDLGQDYLANLSEGGIRLETRTPFEVGERLQLDMAYPGLVGPLSAEGEVRWRRSVAAGQYQIGVAFCSLSPLARSQLKRVLAELKAAQPLIALE